MRSFVIYALTLHTVYNHILTNALFMQFDAYAIKITLTKIC